MKKINLKLKSIITNVTIFALFTDFFTYDFPFYWGFRLNNFLFLLVLIFLIILLRRNIFNSSIFLFLSTVISIFFVIILFSLLNFLGGNLDLITLGKQILGILLHFLVFYLLIEYNRRDIKKLFSIYLKFAFFMAVLGIIQESLYLLCRFLDSLFSSSQLFLSCTGLIIKYINFASLGAVPVNFCQIFGFRLIRVNAIMQEPFSFSIIMAPAFFTAIASFNKNSFNLLSVKKGLVIILAFLLSFSVTSHVVMSFAIAFLLFKYRRYVLSLIIPILLVIIFNTAVSSFRERIPNTLQVLTGQIKWDKANLSTYTLLRNTLVVLDNIKEERLVFGKGLGSHEKSYHRYTNKSFLIKPNLFPYLLNVSDAGSLFLRIFSETGLFGLIIFFIFISRNYIDLNKDPTYYLWIINNSILMQFFIRLIRQGSYFSEGFLFFILLYYFSKKQLKERHFFQKKKVSQVEIK